MSRRDSKPGPSAFAARPSDPETWVRAPARAESAVEAKAELHTARLTIDVTPALRGRIKVTAFRRGQTVADMLRALLEREFAGDADAGAGGRS